MDVPHQSIFALAIESSNPSADHATGSGPGVAIVRVARESERLVPAGPPQVELLRKSGGREDDLMPAIDRLCRRVGANARQIGLVAVSVGPGGFTALRVAVTVGNAIAFVARAPTVAVPSALVVARSTKPSGRFAVALASKGDSTFATVFDPAWQEHPAPQGRLIRAADVAPLGVDRMIADSFLPEPIRAACIEHGIEILPPAFDPNECLELAFRLPAGVPGGLMPLYPREPEALTLWRARQQR
ncbi:MAG: hypothetical protein JNM86_06485 [Phycisphaerae bacterium]|nr:hypothetical protein [Phycisphaerae bacterium]